MPKLVLIRGLPGSGKSTLAREIYNKYGVTHYEQDMYHMVEGKYMWNSRMMPHAFEWCYNSTREALNLGFNVVVSNIFIKVKSIKPYLKLSEDILILETIGNYGSIHEVPEDTLKAMKGSWQDLPDNLIHLKGDYNDSALFFEGI